MSDNTNFDSSSTSETVPLAAWQKARLLMDCVPFLTFLLLAVLVVTVFHNFMGDRLPAIFLFLAFVLLVLGFQSAQYLRDFLSGVAIVTEDVLVISRNAGARKFFANFERLGKMRVMPKAHFQSVNGTRYRVTYSPISKIVWTLEPLDPNFK